MIREYFLEEFRKILLIDHNTYSLIIVDTYPCDISITDIPTSINGNIESIKIDNIEYYVITINVNRNYIYRMEIDIVCLGYRGVCEVINLKIFVDRKFNDLEEGDIISIVKIAEEELKQLKLCIDV
ncbi:hypothetical protein Igag_1392 [Ignisphaera aggregans DSM 17230]|uniref:Uncharacterized protein n=1 Tax=Ignisphaera aggregans (strain DSM 17230 / JCM 13409 / AQ1.S1) TaxID=583356 RepID=E0SQ64_IGNAA|nr:hypothetical protein Igag_1392 [Ignisphaera aggregans DSM 17230]